MERTEAKINELKDRTVEITQHEQKRENRLGKKYDRNSVTCLTKTKYLTCHGTLRKRGEGERAEKYSKK